MKRPKIFFNPIGGSSILSITWYPGPLGDAAEANNGIGVGFFAHNGDLLSVQLDDMNEKKDHKVLEFDRYRVEASVNNGKISKLDYLYEEERAKIRSLGQKREPIT